MQTSYTNDEITKLKNIIEEKKHEISQLRTIIDAMPGKVYWKYRIDEKLVYSGMNHAGFQSMRKLGFKWKKEDILGSTDDFLFDKETADTFVKNDLEVIRTGIECTKEEMANLPSGKKIVQLSTKRPLFNKEGNPIGIAGGSIDISELKETQAALQVALEKAKASDQAKTEFLKNMRHDIRTSLSGIVGCAQLIQMKSNDPVKVAEFVTDLVTSSDALLEFLNKILESIKVATGEIPLLKQRFDLHKELEQIIHLNKPQANVKQLNLYLEHDKNIPRYLLGDPIRIQRIALELVTNALKYTDKGEIKVSTRLVKNENREVIIELRVSDTGMGIPQDKHQEVYTRFTRLIPSYKGIYPGTGLGLSVVKQFIDDLNGEIRIESDIGKGATFICLIPLQESLFAKAEELVDGEDWMERIIF